MKIVEAIFSSIIPLYQSPSNVVLSFLISYNFVQNYRKENSFVYLWRCHKIVHWVFRPRILTMVLTLDGNSEIGTFVRSSLCYLICINIWLDPEQPQIEYWPIVIHVRATYYGLPSNKSTMDSNCPSTS